MCKESRAVIYDHELQVEAYRLQGIMQKFPIHFHEYYVIGFVERGRRRLTCKNTGYIIEAGDLVLFNPMENHACEQVGPEPLDWRCINIAESVMLRVAGEACTVNRPPVFRKNVVPQSGAAGQLRELHRQIMLGQTGISKEECFYFLIEELLADHTLEPEEDFLFLSDEIRAVCRYIERNFAQPVSLRDLCGASGLTKYTLLRHFTRQRGITPYQYLVTTRVNAAKKLLEQGRAPLDAALETGFADQSHFTNFFRSHIGLTPRQYRDIFKDRPQAADIGGCV